MNPYSYSYPNPNSNNDFYDQSDRIRPAFDINNNLPNSLVPPIPSGEFVPFVPFVPFDPIDPIGSLIPPNPLEKMFSPVCDLEYHSVELALETLNLSKSELNSMSVEDLKRNYSHSNFHAVSILLYWKNKHISLPFKIIQH